MSGERVIVIVLDGVGLGAAPDAALYGDAGASSLAHCAAAVDGLRIPNMASLGLGALTDMVGVPPRASKPSGYGKLRPQSAGKDSVSGHWELMGIQLEEPLPTYPHGFPAEVIAEFSKRSGREVIGNKPASGTEIIQELGDEHVRTGKPIVYTSADSVFQIAAHENVIPIAELLSMCEIAREVLQGQHAVGRVIARPFLGSRRGEYFRTQNRRDYPLAPPGETIMDLLVRSGRDVVTVGKIDDLFAGKGITRPHHTVDNQGSIRAMLDFLQKEFTGLLFVNLIEFDMVYGHRRDSKGYATALEEFDRSLPEIQALMQSRDIAMIVADHGVDPTAPGTDHTREFVPLLVFGALVTDSISLGIRQSLSDVAATIANVFDLHWTKPGQSFLPELLK